MNLRVQSRQNSWMRCFFALLLCLTLSGCGTYYTVTIDSLRAEQADDHKGTCFLESGMAGVEDDDLFFQEICRMIAPAFWARGYTIVHARAEAQSVVSVSYEENEPAVTMEQGTEYRKIPVILRNGRKDRVEYVTVEKPTVTVRTTYSARMLLNARVASATGKGASLWRTEVTCSSDTTTDMRTLLINTLPVLQNSLGRRTDGVRKYDVFVDDNGKVTVDELT